MNIHKYTFKIFDPKVGLYCTTKFDVDSYKFAYWTELFDIVEPTTTELPVNLTNSMQERKEKGESYVVNKPGLKGTQSTAFQDLQRCSESNWFFENYFLLSRLDKK